MCYLDRALVGTRSIVATAFAPHMSPTPPVPLPRSTPLPNLLGHYIWHNELISSPGAPVPQVSKYTNEKVGTAGTPTGMDPALLFYQGRRSGP